MQEKIIEKKFLIFPEENNIVVEGELERALGIFYNAFSNKESILIRNGLLDFNGFRINKCPEAHGVNVTGLMAELGVKLDWQWPPEHNLNNQSYVVSLAGKLPSNK